MTKLWHCSACGQINTYNSDIKCTQCFKEWDEDDDDLITEDTEETQDD